MLCDTYETSSMTISGEECMCTSQEVHLVIATCKNAIKDVIQNATNDFIIRVNVIKDQFRSVLSSTKYKLLKTLCMSMYSCELWNVKCIYVFLIR